VKENNLEENIGDCKALLQGTYIEFSVIEMKVDPRPAKLRYDSKTKKWINEADPKEIAAWEERHKKPSS
jgi:hypothetical protein